LFGRKNVEFTVEVEWGSQLFEIGDLVGLTHTGFPDWNNTGRGISGLSGYVISKKFSLTGMGSLVYVIKCFDAFALNDDPITSIDEQTPTRTTLSPKNGSDTVTIHANDAYYDNTGPAFSGEIFVFTFTVTPPNTATSTITKIALTLSTITSAAFDIQQVIQIPFYPNTSTAFELNVKLMTAGGNYTPDTLKVGWTAAADADDPTITLDKVSFVDTGITIEEEV